MAEFAEETGPEKVLHSNIITVAGIMLEKMMI